MRSMASGTWFRTVMVNSLTDPGSAVISFLAGSTVRSKAWAEATGTGSANSESTIAASSATLDVIFPIPISPGISTAGPASSSPLSRKARRFGRPRATASAASGLHKP